MYLLYFHIYFLILIMIKICKYSLYFQFFLWIFSATLLNLLKFSRCHICTSVGQNLAT